MTAWRLGVDGRATPPNAAAVRRRTVVSTDQAIGDSLDAAEVPATRAGSEAGGTMKRVRIPTYRGKVFTVMDNLALVRRPRNLLRTALYRVGDVIPPGREVGDQKVIPMMTSVRVTGVRTDGDRNTYVRAVPVDEGSTAPSGWTRVTNLDGAFLNELVAHAPSEFDVAPRGKNYTVTDGNSLIRTGPPPFRSTGTTIPVGTHVVVTARSTNTDPPGAFVRVGRGELRDGRLSSVERIGWTAASNLTEGWSPVFTTDAWTDDTGPNACWRDGSFIGAKLLVDIVGTGGQMEQITFDSMGPYLRLVAAAARTNVTIAVNSGFRTFGSQKRLHDLFLAGMGDLAAPPGGSNHQHGQAFDLNTTGFDGTTVYDWLKRRGPKLGFIRTVGGEHWHWEYRPDDAARLAAGGTFKLEHVVD